MNESHMTQMPGSGPDLRMRRSGRALPLVLVSCWLAVPSQPAEQGRRGPVLPGLGETFLPSDVDTAHPIYESSFSDPAALKDWRLEGGKGMSVAHGCLVLENDPTNDKNHLVCWLSREAPADFLLEFTVRPHDRRKGLNIVFFSARGLKGESVFDPALKPRDGDYKQYNRGDIQCYHVSYWAAGRETANMRKSPGFFLVAEGRDLVFPASPEIFQTVRIYKRGGNIRVMVDDVIALAYADDGAAHGPIYDHPGWIGLRQMGHTQRCEYGHVSVYPLRPPGL